MHHSLSIALVQIHSRPEVAANVAQITERLSALTGQCRLAVFPENTFCIGAPETVRSVARSENEWWCEFRGAVAAFGGWVVFGGVPVITDRGIRNRALACTREGIQARYDKMHLFQLDPGSPVGVDETRLYTPGEAPRVFEIDGWRIALSICYDVRFPELYRAGIPMDLILCPAAFTDRTGRAHWEVLLRARAIENLCFVAGVGQAGTDPETGVRFHGNSMLIAPWGQVLDRVASDGVSVLRADLDKTEITTARRTLPALDHRRAFPVSASRD